MNLCETMFQIQISKLSRHSSEKNKVAIPPSRTVNHKSDTQLHEMTPVSAAPPNSQPLPVKIEYDVHTRRIKHSPTHIIGEATNSFQ